MAPKINGIDHIHIPVGSWASAEKWYADVMSLRRVEALMPWAVSGGPLTLEDADGTFHLALFERPDERGTTAIAFKATAEDFLAWKRHLEGKGLKLRIADHDLAYSLYFHDPDQNMHEITTYEHELVRAQLK